MNSIHTACRVIVLGFLAIHLSVTSARAEPVLIDAPSALRLLRESYRAEESFVEDAQIRLDSARGERTRGSLTYFRHGDDLLGLVVGPLIVNIDATNERVAVAHSLDASRCLVVESMPDESILETLGRALPPTPMLPIKLILDRRELLGDPSPYAPRTEWQSASIDPRRGGDLRITGIAEGLQGQGSPDAAVEGWGRVELRAKMEPAVLASLSIEVEGGDRLVTSYSRREAVAESQYESWRIRIDERARVDSLSDLRAEPGDLSVIGRRVPVFVGQDASTLVGTPAVPEELASEGAVLLMVRAWGPDVARVAKGAVQSAETAGVPFVVVLIPRLGVGGASLVEQIQPINADLPATPVLLSFAPEQTIERFSAEQETTLAAISREGRVGGVWGLAELLDLEHGRLEKAIADAVARRVRGGS